MYLGIREDENILKLYICIFEYAVVKINSTSHNNVSVILVWLK